MHAQLPEDQREERFAELRLDPSASGLVSRATELLLTRRHTIESRLRSAWYTNADCRLPDCSRCLRLGELLHCGADADGTGDKGQDIAFLDAPPDNSQEVKSEGESEAASKRISVQAMALELPRARRASLTRVSSSLTAAGRSRHPRWRSHRSRR